MVKFTLPALAAIAAGMAFAPAARAQGTLIIYGSDKCPDNVICVRAPESERFRIPKSLRSGTLSPADQPWSARAASIANVGAAGTGSCSATGAGGSAGCWSEMMKQARSERKADAATAAESPLPR